MKNVHLLPIAKPSRLLTSKRRHLQFLKDNASLNPNNHFEGVYQNLYITSDEEIKLSNWACHKSVTNDKYQLVKCTISNKESIQEHWDKIILTTDPDLIKDGVQAIDDTFLEWFVKNPSCEWVDVDTRPKVSSPYEKGFVIDNPNYNKITIPKETQKQHLIDIMKGDEELGLYDEPKQETPEEAAEKLWLDPTSQLTSKNSFIQGAKWQQEQFKNESTAGYIDRHIVEAMVQTAIQKMYTETEVLQLLLKLQQTDSYDNLYEWFEQVKKK